MERFSDKKDVQMSRYSDIQKSDNLKVLKSENLSITHRFRIGNR